MEICLKNDYTVITFDADFIDLATLRGTPPKIIWLRFGNASNLKLAHKIISNAAIIEDFILEENNEIQFLEIN